MESKAVYAGSFDPVTNGHLNIIERAAKMYDELTVAIVVNPHKTGFFTVDERAEIMRAVTSHIPNVTIDKFSGLLADYVNENGFIDELQMAQMNALLFKGNTETVFLMTDPKYSFISSSLIKEVASLGGSVDGLVPEYVVSKIKDKISK